MTLPKPSSPATALSAPALDSWCAAQLGDPIRVPAIPRSPARGASFDIRSPDGHPAYTHYLFRFPAKFHPPVVSWALESYGRRGTPVLDPFTGSGTVQVEALARGMPSVGIDIDPLACLVARAKTTRLPSDELVEGLGLIEAMLSPFRREEQELEGLAATDISAAQFEDDVGGLSYPAIPNLFHWFRRYVVVDLARILWAVDRARFGPNTSRFFRACVASIIRRVSNADPYPVSALEVSRVQLARNADRQICVFDSFVSRARRQIEGMRALHDQCAKVDSCAPAEVVCGDALRARDVLMGVDLPIEYPLVVTSPPYCTAVNYSRRHKLEMYWLGLVRDQDQHIDLAHSYLGRRWVRRRDWEACGDFGVPELDRTLSEVAERKRPRARALRHYFWSMSRAFGGISRVMPKAGVLSCATGDSVSCGLPIMTTRFLTELASEHFQLRNHFSYVLRNRYMQYPLRNGKGIRHEHILVFERR